MFFHPLGHCRLRGCEQALEPPWLGTKILIGDADLGAEFCGSVPWPARIEEDRARQGDQVGIAGRHDRLGLFKPADHSDSNHRYADCGFDCTGKRYLVARSHRNCLGGMQASA